MQKMPDFTRGKDGRRFDMAKNLVLCQKKPIHSRIKPIIQQPRTDFVLAEVPVLHARAMGTKLSQIDIDEICIGHVGPFRLRGVTGILPRRGNWSTGNFGRNGNFPPRCALLLRFLKKINFFCVIFLSNSHFPLRKAEKNIPTRATPPALVEALWGRSPRQFRHNEARCAMMMRTREPVHEPKTANSCSNKGQAQARYRNLLQNRHTRRITLRPPGNFRIVRTSGILDERSQSCVLR